MGTPPGSRQREAEEDLDGLGELENGVPHPNARRRSALELEASLLDHLGAGPHYF